jgi:hypothetical protein
MKANEAPEKIYIDVSLDSAWGMTERSYDNEVEYTRTDAFIEKACDAYCKVCGHYAHTTPNHICRQACDYYKNFVKYMKRNKNEA